MKERVDFSEAKRRWRLEPEAPTGIAWKVRRGRVLPGAVAGTFDQSIGRWRLRSDGVAYLTSHIVWLLVHSEWPPGQLQHVDGDVSNNSIGNLRLLDLRTENIDLLTRLHQVFEWDDEKQELTRKRQTSGRVKVGDVAGILHKPSGYEFVSVDGKHYKKHRIIFALANGCWPEKDIDHINGDRSDNRLKNLREATRSQNNANAKLYSNNTSGHKGVSYSKSLRKWHSYISFNNQRTHLGYFATAEEAARVRRLEAAKLHGKFARAK